MSRENEKSDALIGNFGKKSRRWKGEVSSYAAKHMWLTKHYDKGNECEICKTNKASRLEWANISGEYKRNREDYRVLCPSCHRKSDLKSEYCKNGHKYTPETTYITKQGWKDCRECRRESQRRYMKKKRSKLN